MTIAAILKRKGGAVVSIGGDDPVHQAVDLLAQHRIGCVPVMDGDAVTGIFSERDLLYRLASDGPSVLDRPVREVMTTPAHTVTPDMDVLEALSQITRRRFRHLPVLENGRMVGLVSIGDLVKFRIDSIESEAAAMRDYIQTA